ncbi:MAG: hypothetical protein ACM3SY_09980 [Candidatus Omnitrophota bacterium]
MKITVETPVATVIDMGARIRQITDFRIMKRYIEKPRPILCVWQRFAMPTIWDCRLLYRHGIKREVERDSLYQFWNMKPRELMRHRFPNNIGKEFNLTLNGEPAGL